MTIDVTVLLAVIVALRLGRRTQPRSRDDEKPTVVIVPAPGVPIAPTSAGRAIHDILGQLANSITRAGAGR